MESMSALQRHHHLLRQGFVTDEQAVKAEHRFLWEPESGRSSSASEDSWEKRLARRYYSKLYREYALADLSRYKEGAVGLRWRTEQEVFDGRGQFTCGNKACDSNAGLQSFELLFAYEEHGEHKQALVKLRVCRACEEKLHYRKHKEERRHERHERKRDKSHKRKRDKSDKRKHRSRGHHTGHQSRSRSRSRSRSHEREDLEGDHGTEGLQDKDADHEPQSEEARLWAMYCNDLLQ